jgi:hypothetical protein
MGVPVRLVVGEPTALPPVVDLDRVSHRLRSTDQRTQAPQVHEESTDNQADGVHLRMPKLAILPLPGQQT